MSAFKCPRLETVFTEAELPLRHSSVYIDDTMYYNELKPNKISSNFEICSARYKVVPCMGHSLHLQRALAWAQ